MICWRTALAVVAVTACCVGCGGPAGAAQSVTHTPDPAATTASAVVDALTSDHVTILHPVDTTAADCANAGCAQAITTDRFRIMSFSSSGAATKYAADHGMEQVESIAVGFSPVVPQPERDRLWRAITHVVD
jgi:hypothetical protein